MASLGERRGEGTKKPQEVSGKMGVRVGRVPLEKVWWPPVLLFFYFVVAICIVVLPLARIYLLSSKQDNEILLNS